MQPSDLPMLGGCQCATVRYAVWDAPEAVYVCHCTECQRQSASAFGVSVIVRSDAFEVTHGAPRLWQRPSDRGNVLKCWFCGTCGTRVWHVSAGAPSMRSIKGGTLDGGVDLTTAVHLFTQRARPGVIIPETALQFPGEPDA